MKKFLANEISSFFPTKLSEKTELKLSENLNKIQSELLEKIKETKEMAINSILSDFKKEEDFFTENEKIQMEFQIKSELKKTFSDNWIAEKSKEFTKSFTQKINQDFMKNEIKDLSDKNDWKKMEDNQYKSEVLGKIKTYYLIILLYNLL